MSINGIEASVDRLVQQLPVGQGVQRDIKAAFVDLLARVISEGGAGQPAATATTDTPPATATQLLPESMTGLGSTGSTASTLLKDPGAPILESLSNDLTAEDSAYNQREVALRERLNLPELERRLRASAASMGVEYSSTDLDGILRNAGYGAAHLGSSERYMAAIEKFTDEAYKNYRQRAGNVPGANA